MWRGDVLVGHVRIEVQDWIITLSSGAVAELRTGGFTSRAVRYEVLWLDGAEKREVLEEVVGLPGDDQS